MIRNLFAVDKAPPKFPARTESLEKEKFSGKRYATNLVPTARRSFGANLTNTFETFDKDCTCVKLLNAMRLLVLRVAKMAATGNVFFGHLR